MLIHEQARSMGPCYNLSVDICQSLPDSELLEEFQASWGGSIYSYKRGEKCRGGFGWRITGKQAAAFMLDIAPYVRVKKEQVELALRFAEHLGQYPLASLARLKNKDDVLIARIHSERKQMRIEMRNLKAPLKRGD